MDPGLFALSVTKWKACRFDGCCNGESHVNTTHLVGSHHRTTTAAKGEKFSRLAHCFKMSTSLAVEFASTQCLCHRHKHDNSVMCLLPIHGQSVQNTFCDVLVQGQGAKHLQLEAGTQTGIPEQAIADKLQLRHV